MKIPTTMIGSVLAAVLLHDGVLAYADGLLNSQIPPYEQGLIDELLSCIEAALESGLTTNQEVSAACSQEKAALNGAVPEMGDFVVEVVLD